jgi:hypothetical protein
MNILFTYAGEERDLCIWITSFDSSSTNNNIGYIEVGEVEAEDQGGNLVVLDGYVIDWHYGAIDGPIEFISSGGTENEGLPHPLTGSQKVWQADGNWYPVLRYVVVGGIQYEKIDNSFCDLPVIIVEKVECDNGPYDDDLRFGWHFEYNASIDDPTNASQTIRLYINADCLVSYVAFKFHAYSVPDLLKVSYYDSNEDTETLIGYFAVGGYLPQGANVVYNPDLGEDVLEYRYIFSANSIFQYMHHVIDISSFDCHYGDYLIFEVFPTYKSSDPDTHWELWLECLDSGAFDECAIWMPNCFNDIDLSSISLVDDLINCRYVFTADLLCDPIVLTGNTIKYNWTTERTWINTGGETPFQDNNIQIYIESEKGFTRPAITSNIACTPADSLITIIKTGNIISFNFEDVDDYNWYADQLYNITHHAYFTNYTSITKYIIGSFSDAGGGQVTVTTSIAHVLSNGEWVTIIGTTNYNGQYYISNVSSNSFEITHSWDGDDGIGTCYSQDDANLETHYKRLRLTSQRMDNDVDNGNITAFSDAGGGYVTVTSAAHGLDPVNDDGVNIGIRLTSNYNAIYQITNITTNTFDILATWNGNDGTGFWWRYDEGCTGDTFITLNLYFGPESIINYNPGGLYFTITLQNITSDYISIGCDQDRISETSNYYTNIHATYILANNTWYTYARNEKPWELFSVTWIENTPSYKENGNSWLTIDLLYSPCELYAEWCRYLYGTTYVYEFFKYYLKVSFTTVPYDVNYFKVESQINPVTGCKDTWRLIYEKSGAGNESLYHILGSAVGLFSVLFNDADLTYTPA